MDKLEIFSLKDIPLIEPGDDLNKLILDSIINTIEKLVNNDVVLIKFKTYHYKENGKKERKLFKIIMKYNHLILFFLYFCSKFLLISFSFHH